jgi:hypothetical protein
MHGRLRPTLNDLDLGLMLKDFGLRLIDIATIGQQMHGVIVNNKPSMRTRKSGEPTNIGEIG